MQIDSKGLMMSMRMLAGVLLMMRRVRAIRKLGIRREVRRMLRGECRETVVGGTGFRVVIEEVDMEGWGDGSGGLGRGKAGYVVFFYGGVGLERSESVLRFGGLEGTKESGWWKRDMVFGVWVLEDKGVVCVLGNEKERSKQT
jgi:hypothetical protein